MRSQPDAAEPRDDEPVTLKEACRLFFGGRLSPSSLRTEASKGRLQIMRIAGKDFVTRQAIEDMKIACIRPPPPVSSSRRAIAGQSPAGDDLERARETLRRIKEEARMGPKGRK